MPTQENFVLPEKPARGLNRQVAHGSMFNSHWYNQSFEYSDDELALARTPHTLKSTNVRTGNVPKETSDDESTNILGTQYLRKRSMSVSNIALQDNSNVQNMVNKISYGKHCATLKINQMNLL